MRAAAPAARAPSRAAPPAGRCGPAAAGGTGRGRRPAAGRSAMPRLAVLDGLVGPAHSASARPRSACRWASSGVAARSSRTRRGPSRRRLGTRPIAPRGRMLACASPQIARRPRRRSSASYKERAAGRRRAPRRGHRRWRCTATSPGVHPGGAACRTCRAPARSPGRADRRSRSDVVETSRLELEHPSADESAASGYRRRFND